MQYAPNSISAGALPPAGELFLQISSRPYVFQLAYLILRGRRGEKRILKIRKRKGEGAEGKNGKGREGDATGREWREEKRVEENGERERKGKRGEGKGRKGSPVVVPPTMH